MRPWLAVPALILFAGWQSCDALASLDRAERERDVWQRPGEVIAALALAPGQTVVDLGCGSGYFAMRLAAPVGRTGQVLAVDIARTPLAIVRIRAMTRRAPQVHAILSSPDDPRLSRYSPVDAILVANTYHEIERPAPVLDALWRALKSGGRLVVLDRQSRTPWTTPRRLQTSEHRLRVEIAAAEVAAAGFRLLRREDPFVDRPGDDIWWLLVFTKPPVTDRTSSRHEP